MDIEMYICWDGVLAWVRGTGTRLAVSWKRVWVTLKRTCLLGPMNAMRIWFLVENYEIEGAPECRRLLLILQQSYSPVR